MKEHSQEYLDYLQSEHWSKLRKEAFNRANRKCEACGSKKRLNGHHLRYRSPLTASAAGDIMALCGRCHDAWHAWLDKTGKRLSDFCRESTRGAILVLLTIRVDKPIAERPVYFHLNPTTQPPQKTSKSERKRQRAALKAERKAAQKLKMDELKVKKEKRSKVKTDLLSMPEFVDVLTTSKTRDEFKKRLRALTVGWNNRNSILAHAWVIRDRGIRPPAPCTCP